MPQLYIAKEEGLSQKTLAPLQQAASAMEGLEAQLENVQDMLKSYLNNGLLNKERYRASLTLQNAMVGTREMLPQTLEQKYKLVTTKNVEALSYKPSAATAKKIAVQQAQATDSAPVMSKGKPQERIFLTEAAIVQKMTTLSYIGLRSGFSLLVNPVVKSGSAVRDDKKLNASNYDTPILMQEKNFLKTHLAEMGEAIKLVQRYAKSLDALDTVSPKAVAKLPKGEPASQQAEDIAMLAEGASKACEQLKIAYASLSKVVQSSLSKAEAKTEATKAAATKPPAAKAVATAKQTEPPAGNGVAPTENLVQVNASKQVVNVR